jgi:ankyrin repeat protein
VWPHCQRLLQSYKATLRNKNGEHALHVLLALLEGVQTDSYGEQLLKWLLQQEGLEANLPDSAGVPPLVRLARCRLASSEAYQLLLERGANVNAADAQGETMLHTLVRNQQLSVLEQLFAEGLLAEVDFDRKNREGHTPVQLAQQMRQQQPENNTVAFIHELLQQQVEGLQALLQEQKEEEAAVPAAAAAAAVAVAVPAAPAHKPAMIAGASAASSSSVPPVQPSLAPSRPSAAPFLPSSAPAPQPRKTQTKRHSASAVAAAASSSSSSSSSSSVSGPPNVSGAISDRHDSLRVKEFLRLLGKEFDPSSGQQQLSRLLEMVKEDSERAAPLLHVNLQRQQVGTENNIP